MIDGWFNRSSGGGAAGGVWEFVEAQVAAASASLDFTTLDFTTYEAFWIHADRLRPTVDNQLLVQFRIGAVWQTANYAGWWVGAAATGALPGAFAVLTLQAGAIVQGGNQEAAGEGVPGTNFRVEFARQLNDADVIKEMHLWGTGGQRSNVAGQLWVVEGRWVYNPPGSSPAAINGVRLIYSSTTIADGTARLYGRRAS